MSVDVTAAGEACNIQDDDGNWWDIVANETADCAAMFEGGDR